MELLQLRYFFESAQHESFAKTAEKYMVPSSSVSASVRQLEKELDCKLFDRTSNRIILNNNGKKLKQTLNIVFSNLDKVAHELTTKELDTREIKILVRAMRSAITDHIIEFNRINPHISFNMVFDFNEKDFEKYDIVIDKITDIYTGFESFEQFNMKIRLKVNSKSPLLGRKLSLKQLANQPFVTLNEQSNMHSMLIDNCKKAGFVPNIIATINDILCYEKMISSGFGIGLARETDNAASNIKSLDVTDFNEKYQVYTYYKKENAYGNVLQFLNFLKNKSDLLV